LIERLEPLQRAISSRLKDLDGNADSESEQAVLRTACEKILEIISNELGFLP
jgi:hypothetical protein